MLSIIDRYISKLFILFFLSGLAVFVVLFVAVDFMTNISSHNPASSAVIQYYLLSIPSLVYQMLPVACLLGTIFTLSNLSRSNELVALFSSGMSLARISTPILVLVVLISSVSFWLNDRVVPIVNQRKNYVYYVEILKKPGLYSTVKTDKIWYRSGNVLFNIKTLQSDSNTAEGLTMYYFDSAWKLIQMITARHVELNGSNWELHNGAVTLFAKDSSVPMTQNFDSKTITVSDESADIQKGSQSSETLSVGELKRFITRNRDAGLDTLRYEVDYHAKFSFAFAAFVMSFLGIPFSVTKQRGGGAAFNVGVTILLAFGYWAAYSSGITLGRHGAVPPVIAVWLPNMVMVALSAIFLFRLKK
ncbi:MAG TPA: LPS export ABC transporter permease LptG [Bdellovibrionales bacterium]|jgi:lipopolysaccharide export system permease protein|nr:LPS export ABC transporter permease LptG [Bdellovibrionales bacterium]